MTPQERLAHLRDQLAAREQYGNGDDHAAGLLRDELADLEEQEVKPVKSIRKSGASQ